MSTRPTTHQITHRGVNLQNIIDAIGHTPVSAFNGDLVAAFNYSPRIVIDVDCDLDRTVVIPDGGSLITTTGKLHVRANGLLRTKSISSPQYYKSGDVAHIDITSDAQAGSTNLTVLDASGLSVGDKLVIKNGYCDMWRVLEASATDDIRRRAVHNLTYKTEIVTITGVSGNTLTVTPLVYDYPTSVQTYGYIDQENALPEYAGFTVPSVTKLVSTSIKLDLDMVVHRDATTTAIQISYTDGVDLSARIQSEASIDKLILLTQCDNVNVHDVIADGHRGHIVMVQESCRGVMDNLIATNWRGGKDCPYAVMLMSVMVVSNVNVSGSTKQVGSSAFYTNTCDGGTIKGVIGKYLAKVVDVSFSRGVVADDMRGYNVDMVAGSYCSSSCIVSNGTVDGYFAIDSQSTEYKQVLIAAGYSTNMIFDKLTRLNDKGWGGVRVVGSVGNILNNVHSPRTLLGIVIGKKDNEPAHGKGASHVATIRSCHFGKVDRYSQYYDSTDENGYSYPYVVVEDLRCNGAITLGKNFGAAESWEVFTSGACSVEGSCFGIPLKGRVGSLTVTSKDTALPDVRELRIDTKPNRSDFFDVDGNIVGGSWSPNFQYGSYIADYITRNVYVNTSQYGTNAVWSKV